MAVKYGNNVSKVLVEDVGPSDLVIRVNNFLTLPDVSGENDYAYLTMVNALGVTEVVKLTSYAVVIVNSTNEYQLTVVRAQDDTTAKYFFENDKIELRINSALLDSLSQEPTIIDCLYDTVTNASTIAAGTVVAASSSTSNTDAPLVEKVANNGTLAANLPVVGFTTASITSSTSVTVPVKVVTSGIIEWNTSSYAFGDVLYVGAGAGTLTNVLPQGSAKFIQAIGVVLKSDAEGLIKVNIASDVVKAPNLDTGDIFIGGPYNNTTSTDLATAISAAGAFTIGGEKVPKVFVDTSAPTTGHAAGDLWVDSDGYSSYIAIAIGAGLVWFGT